MKQVRGEKHCLLRTNAGAEALLENHRLVPGDGMNGHIAYARQRRRKWKLPHHRQSSRHHFIQFETWKPQAKKKGIGHRSVLPVHSAYLLDSRISERVKTIGMDQTQTTFGSVSDSRSEKCKP